MRLPPVIEAGFWYANDRNGTQSWTGYEEMALKDRCAEAALGIFRPHYDFISK